jgi:4a-hydroxytetrahydrobiopterin dehydratase
MDACDLTKKHCKPCEGGVPALKPDESKRLLKDVKGWKLSGNKIEKDYVFKNFVQALKFVNRVGEIAEGEGHHPDILLHGYKNVRIDLWTHAIGGLSENDFIVAAKIDTIG